jgi:regulator of sigma E protease
MLIALFVVVGIAVLILTHEAGHFFAAKLFGMKVDEFGFGFPPRIFAIRRGETEYSFNWLPFGGFVKIAGENEPVAGDPSVPDDVPHEDRKRYFTSQPIWKRMIVILAGVAINFVTGWLVISAIFMMGTPKAVVITDIQPDSPAAVAGLKAGDMVRGFETSNDLITAIEASRGKEFSLAVRRGGEELNFTVIPRDIVQEGQGRVGVVLADGGVDRQPPHLAAWYGLRQAGVLSYMTVKGFYQIVSQLVVRQELASGVVGPVGIFSVAQQTGELGYIYLLQLFALIAINLAVINVLPLPALDGGRFLFLIIEKIKGSPLSQKFEVRLILGTYALLAILMIALTVRDVRGLW